MSHRSQRDFIAALRRAYPIRFAAYGLCVLEIGSLNVNGTVRDFFEPSINFVYWGIDVGKGPGVDVVCDGADFDSALQFDVVISCNCFEHNPRWVETFANMVRLARPGGMIIVTTTGPGFPRHGLAGADPASSPLTVAKGWDFYQNFTPADFQRNLWPALGELSEYTMFNAPRGDEPGEDMFFVGVKAYQIDRSLRQAYPGAQLTQGFAARDADNTR